MNLIYQNFGPKRRWAFVVMALALLVFITIQSLGASNGSIHVNNADKYAHALAYLCLGLAVLPALPRVWPVVVWGMLSLYGIGIEVLQGSMGLGRKADIFDAIANSSGALLAVLLWLLVSFMFARKSG